MLTYHFHILFFFLRVLALENTVKRPPPGPLQPLLALWLPPEHLTGRGLSLFIEGKAMPSLWFLRAARTLVKNSQHRSERALTDPKLGTACNCPSYFPCVVGILYSFHSWLATGISIVPSLVEQTASHGCLFTGASESLKACYIFV